MAGYNTIRGLRVKYLSADPAGAEDGQVWYNSTTGNLRVEGIQGTAAWASGGNLPTPNQSAGGFGTQTAAVSAGGAPPTDYGLKTFEYDGSSWTAGNNMTRTPTGGPPYISAGIKASGILTAGWAAGGGTPGTNANNLTENYDGTNWTASATMPVNRVSGMASGPQTAGLYFTGYDGSDHATTSLYDGEAWTGGPSLNTARRDASGSGVYGSQTAALCFTGNTPPQTNKTEEYNGTAWTEVTVFPRSASYVGYAGSQTDLIAFSGYTAGGPAVTTTTGYDGTSWSSRPSMAAGRLFYGSNSGTGSNALAWGGEGLTNATEEFTTPVETKNLSVS